MAGVDWEERRLCDDGGCTGIIGGDGRCHVCGSASQFWGDERRRGMRSDAEADADAEARRAARKLPEAEGEIAERRLCPDGGCTGLVGSDGKCKVCGMVDDAAPPVRGELGASGAGDGVSTGEDEGGEDEGGDEGEGEDDEYDDEDEDDDDDGDGEEDGDDDGDDDDGDVDDGEPEAEESGGRIAARSAGDRELCPDGDCTGLIGADGRCKVCGKRAEA